MTFDPDPAVRQQQDDQIEQNLKDGGRGLGEFVWGGLTGNSRLAADGLRRYAEATGLVDPETVDAAAGGFSAAGSGTGARPGPCPGGRPLRGDRGCAERRRAPRA